MNKKNVISIAITIGIVLIIIGIILVLLGNKMQKNKLVEKIILTKYNDESEIEKNIEVTNKKQIKEIKNICSNPALEQDDRSPYIAIKNDVKLDLGNGEVYIIQLGLEKYCRYENTNSDIQLVIKMPDGLLEKVNSILDENS